MKKTLIAVAAIATLAAPTTVLARPDADHRPGWERAQDARMAHMFKALDLSAEQRAKVKAIRQRHREAVKADWQALKTRQQELATLLRSPGATADQAIAKQREIDAIRARLAESRVRAWFETRAVLTPAQLQKLPALKPDRQPEHVGW